MELIFCEKSPTWGDGQEKVGFPGKISFQRYTENVGFSSKKVPICNTVD